MAYKGSPAKYPRPNLTGFRAPHPPRPNLEPFGLGLASESNNVPTAKLPGKQTLDEGAPGECTAYETSPDKHPQISKRTHQELAHVANSTAADEASPKRPKHNEASLTPDASDRHTVGSAQTTRSPGGPLCFSSFKSKPGASDRGWSVVHYRHDVVQHNVDECPHCQHQRQAGKPLTKHGFKGVCDRCPFQKDNQKTLDEHTKTCLKASDLRKKIYEGMGISNSINASLEHLQESLDRLESLSGALTPEVRELVSKLKVSKTIPSKCSNWHSYLKAGVRDTKIKKEKPKPAEEPKAVAEPEAETLN